ncbi:uncharacterized protein LOC106172537 [Lingula anatina]|uniref:Uncharacterized protein LOC106172537 n=1 Tax=Lingula anatina TaxID=7574 RepID=A0A1S3JFT0_LINAN|nr:uncharacterized protein LOC106172537 [Lingula anatina]|eukprot:XP_013408754.2 uncharacterized protein LOC106172537 [Lingula anatina]
MDSLNIDGLSVTFGRAIVSVVELTGSTPFPSSIVWYRNCGTMESQTREQEDKPLSGKVAVVTGASFGIGAAISKMLAAEGAKVVLVARGEKMLLETKDKIEKEGGVALAVKCDVTKRNEVKEMIKRSGSTFGPVDILVNNAGVWHFTFMKYAKEDLWEEIVDVNIKGVLNCIGAVISDMCVRKRGHIINVTGVRDLPLKGMAVYTGAKYFLEGMTRTLRQEVCQEGVKVTNVHLGPVDTPGLATSLSNMDDDCKKLYNFAESTNLTADASARAVIQALKQPQDVAVNDVCLVPQAFAV